MLQYNTGTIDNTVTINRIKKNTILLQYNTDEIDRIQCCYY